MANREMIHAFYRVQYEMIHIGELIKAEVQRQGRSVSWLARELHCDRSNVYDIFKRQSIDTQQLLRISQLLGRNFFHCYIVECDACFSKSQV